jgi:glycosyltransferase involved in cell wall biosynthesis
MAESASHIHAGGVRRILWLIDSMTVGGAERLVPIFAQSYDKTRFELSVACLKEIEGNSMAAELERIGVPVTVIGARNLRDLAAFRRLTKFIREHRFDLIHTHLTYSDIWGRIAARLTGARVVSTLHVAKFTAHNMRGSRTDLIERLADLVRRNIGGPVIAVSDSLKAKFRDKGYSNGRVITVRNGISLEEFELPREFSRDEQRARLGIPVNAQVIVCVSALREGKGHRLLLDAAAKLVREKPEVRFLIVGGGPLESELRRRAEANNLCDKVVFTGTRTDIPELLAVGDVFVLPSENDSLPTAFFEAMALGLPSIGLRSGGVPEIVSHGETGIVVDSPDAKHLADAIRKLVNDPPLARAMGAGGRRRVEAEFTSEKWVRDLERVYEEVLDKG